MAIRNVLSLWQRPVRWSSALAVAFAGTSALFAQEAEKVTYSGPFPREQEMAAPATARAESAEGRRFDIGAVVITGDREPVLGLPNWSAYENNALYEPMAESDIEAFRQRLLKDLQDQGYLFATVSVFRDSLANGFLKFRVHVGEKGEVTVSGNRWHTAEQVLEDLAWQTGEDFNYRSLYQELFSLNTQPNLRVVTQLKPRVVGDRRVVDVALDVQDRFPLHLAWQLSNTGSKETGDWRSRATAQFTNLLEKGATASLEWLTDPTDLDAVNAWTASVYVPGQKWWGINVYGGYSASEVEDVVLASGTSSADLNISGDGYFVGVNFRAKLKETKRYSIDSTIGWLFQEVNTTNQIVPGGPTNTPTTATQQRVSLSMPRFTVGYADKQWDGWGGRNFVQNTIFANFGDRLGSSPYITGSTSGTTPENQDFKNTFFVSRFQWARLQKLWGRADGTRLWTAFFRVDAQLTGDALPSALKFGIGGMDSVRGFRERVVSGDWGYTATMEFRTPLWENFLPGLKQKDDVLSADPNHWSTHRLQALVFVDAGWAAGNTTTPSFNAENQHLTSAGVGLRLALTPYSQMRFDVGVPMKSVENEDSVRGHVSLQLQY